MSNPPPYRRVGYPDGSVMVVNDKLTDWGSAQWLDGLTIGALSDVVRFVDSGDIDSVEGFVSLVEAFAGTDRAESIPAAIRVELDGWADVEVEELRRVLGLAARELRKLATATVRELGDPNSRLWLWRLRADGYVDRDEALEFAPNPARFTTIDCPTRR